MLLKIYSQLNQFTIKEGEVQETPFSYNIKKDEEAIDKSKSEIENDKDIQNFIKKFNGKIKKIQLNQ